jgi:hypothetical protein
METEHGKTDGQRYRKYKEEEKYEEDEDNGGKVVLRSVKELIS